MEWQKAKRNDDGSIVIPTQWLFLHYYEAFNILFRIENVLRMIVYTVLKDELHEKWVDCNVTDAESGQKTIGSLAKQRISQTTTFGYLGYNVSCPVMFLNGGELIRLITSDGYWKYFKPYFLGSKEIIKNKLYEIEAIRNAMAHFRPIKEDDVEVIKQNAKHVLTCISPMIEAMLSCFDVVPTNTNDPWYRELSVVGNDLCIFRLYQSRDGIWIRIAGTFRSPVLAKRAYEKSIWYRVLTIKSAAILKHHRPLANLIIHLSEESPNKYFFVEGEQPKFKKDFSMVFSRKSLETNYQEIKKQLEHVIGTISKETELIQKDHLAKGDLVCAIHTYFTEYQGKSKPYWGLDIAPLVNKVVEGDPDEYWGTSLSYYPEFVTATENYPWMPTSVSAYDGPF